MNILEILNYFRSGEHSIASLSEADQAVLRNSLQTEATFTSTQKGIIQNWYLVVPTEQLELVQEMGASGRSPEEIEQGTEPNPLRYRFSVQQIDGVNVVRADLLTDIGYSYAFPVFRSLALKEFIL